MEEYNQSNIAGQMLGPPLWCYRSQSIVQRGASEPAYKRWLHCPKILFISMVQSSASVGVRLTSFVFIS